MMTMTQQHPAAGQPAAQIGNSAANLPVVGVQARGRPLLPIQGVMSLVAMTQDQALALIDEGKLLWAWDLGLQHKRARRRLLRVLPACVADFLVSRECLLEFQDVLSQLLPPTGAAVTVASVSMLLNVTNDFVYALASRGELKLLTRCRKGPGGSARISVPSFIEFLKQRRYPFPEAV